MSLSLQQSFRVRNFEHQVEKLDEAQLKKYLIEMFKQSLLKENLYKETLKEKWGLDKSDKEKITNLKEQISEFDIDKNLKDMCEGDNNDN